MISFKFHSDLLRKSQKFQEVGHSGMVAFACGMVPALQLHSCPTFLPLHCQGWDVFGRSFEPEADLSHTMCSCTDTLGKSIEVFQVPKIKIDQRSFQN